MKNISLIFVLCALCPILTIGQTEQCSLWEEITLQLDGKNKDLIAVNMEIPSTMVYQYKQIDWYQSDHENFDISSSHLLSTTDIELTDLNRKAPKILSLKISQNSKGYFADYLSLWSGSGFRADELWIRNNKHAYFTGDDLRRSAVGQRQGSNASGHLTSFLSSNDFVPENTIVIILFNTELSPERVLKDFKAVEECSIVFLRYANLSLFDFNIKGCTQRYFAGIEKNQIASAITFSGPKLLKEKEQIILNRHPAQYISHPAEAQKLFEQFTKDAARGREKVTLSVKLSNAFPMQQSFVKGVIKGDGPRSCCSLVSPELEIKISTNNEHLSLFPNPTNNFIHFKPQMTNNYHYKIWTLDGKLVAEGQQQAESNTINIASLHEGTYALQIMDLTSNIAYSSRFTKVNQ